MERVVIPLASFRSIRVIMLGLGAMAAVVTVVVAVGTFALLATGIPFVTEGSLFEAVIGTAIVLVVAALFVGPKVTPWIGWKHEPALIVEPGFLTVHHPGLGEPLVVPRQLIQVASLDTTSGGILAGYRRFRLVGGAPTERRRSVLSARGIARLTAFGAPNVVVLFTQPLETARPARRVRWGEHVLFSGGKGIRGIALEVSDAGRARAELAKMDVLRAITFQDAATSGLALTMNWLR